MTLTTVLVAYVAMEHLPFLVAILRLTSKLLF